MSGIRSIRDHSLKALFDYMDTNKDLALTLTLTLIEGTFRLYGHE